MITNEKLNQLYFNKKTYFILIEKYKNYDDLILQTSDETVIYFLRQQQKNVIQNIEEISQEIKSTEDLINLVVQPYKLILILKYCENYSVGKIAKTLNYSPQRIYQLSKIAVSTFEEIDNSYISTAKNMKLWCNIMSKNDFYWHFFSKIVIY